MEFVNTPGPNRPLAPQMVILGNPNTGLPFASVPVTLSGESLTVSVPAAVEINNDSGNPIPVIGPLTDAQLRASMLKTEPLGIPGESRSQAATAASQDVSLTPTITRISIKARNADLRYKVGVGAQTASSTLSHFIELGERLDIAVPLGAHIAVIRDSAAVADGILCITELS